MSGPGSRPTDAELWAAVEVTLRDVILPDLEDEWARASAVQLIGLATYAQRRGPDSTAVRDAELAEALERLAASGNEIVLAAWPDPEGSATVAASRCLAEAAVRDDGAAAAVRAELRTLIVRQLDDDLDETGPLLDFFRGRMPDA